MIRSASWRTLCSAKALSIGQTYVVTALLRFKPRPDVADARGCRR